MSTRLLPDLVLTLIDIKIQRSIHEDDRLIVSDRLDHVDLYQAGFRTCTPHHTFYFYLQSKHQCEANPKQIARN